MITCDAKTFGWNVDVWVIAKLLAMIHDQNISRL